MCKGESVFCVTSYHSVIATPSVSFWFILLSSPRIPSSYQRPNRAFGLLILYLLPSLHIRPLFSLSSSARCGIYCLLKVHGSWLLMQIEVSARPNRYRKWMKTEAVCQFYFATPKLTEIVKQKYVTPFCTSK